MSILHEISGRKNIIFFLIGLLLILTVLILVWFPQVVQAGSQISSRSSKSLIISPTPQPHLLWQYNSLVAFNPESCGLAHGINFFGSASILINGGGVLSYGCLESSGYPSVVVKPPFGINFAGDFYPGNGFFDPDPEWTRNLIDLEVNFTSQAQEACDQLPVQRSGKRNLSTEEIIYPGNYSTIIVTDTLTMLPGLYCVTGDFIVNTGAILMGEMVTIYMTGGDFFMHGGSEVHLSAPEEGIVTDPIWRDLLLYVANNHVASISIIGTQLSTYHGVIYAPASNIEVTDNAEYYIQLIGWNVEVGGTSDISLVVDFWP